MTPIEMERLWKEAIEVFFHAVSSLYPKDRGKSDVPVFRPGIKPRVFRM